MALIEIRGLTKLYRMGTAVVHALDGVDLTIERGDFVAITGPSGSGKSTMMHLLGCLDRPTAGRYILDGRDVSDLSDRELADVRNRQIGFVFQTFNLINRTSAAENVGIPLFYARQSHTREPSLRALERVGLATRAHHNPNELSGGERQRVAIARAIVNNPAVVLADEPTGNLDSRTGEQIMEIFRSLNEQGVTIIMVTHEPDIARQARRIVQMRDGKVVSDRGTAELLVEEGQAPARKWTAIAPDAVPAITADEPAAGPPEAQMPPRRMRGVSAGLTLGILGVGFWAVAMGMQLYLRSTTGPQEFDPTKPPPTSLILAGLGACTVMLLAMCAGVLAIVFSWGARKRMRTEPGNWLGWRRALIGLLLGVAAVAAPIVTVVGSIVLTLVKR